MLLRELNRASCKTYFLGCERARRAALVDPLRERVDRYLAFLAYRRYDLELVIDTHTHADHRTGAWDLRELTGARTVMHARAPAPDVDVHVREGDHLHVGELELRVLETPGHSADAISLHVEGRVLTGDSLLIGATGRTDLPGGDAGAEYDAIHAKLFPLPDETLVLPGHDYRGLARSTIGQEKRTNPRLAGRSHDEFVALMNGLGLPLPDKIQEALQANQSSIEDGSVSFPAVARLADVPSIAPQELHAWLASSDPPLVIDVRQADEFSGELGHVSGSRSIPLRDLPRRAAELASHKAKDIVCVCRSGVRSTTAAAMLAGLGFERVRNMKGGMLDWIGSHLPVER